MDSNFKRLSSLLSFIIAGLVIGLLISALGGFKFRQYTMTFHSYGSSHWVLFNAAHGVGASVGPVMGFGSMIGAIYFCWRRRLKMRYVLSGGLCGLLGFLFDTYVMASPGPNYHTAEYLVPTFCFLGAVIGAVVQAAQRDWQRNGASSCGRNGGIRSRTTYHR